MQWGQIKTLFILCFLIVNIFLLQQLLNTRDQDLSYQEEVSSEETITTDIEGLDQLSNETIQESYLYANRKQIDEEDKDDLQDMNGQDVAIIDESIIVAQFSEPVPINMEDEQSYSETLQSNILAGNKYEYWGMDESSNILIFFQMNGERPIYYNKSALLLIMLNEQGEMVNYMQTMLDDEDNQQEDNDLISEVDAVSLLYNNTRELTHGDEITDVKLGFHTLTALPNGGQVLAPMWNVIVNGQRNYFIHAIEGYPYPRDDSSFLKDTINEILDNLQRVEIDDEEDNDNDNDEFIGEIEERLTKIMNQ